MLSHKFILGSSPFLVWLLFLSANMRGFEEKPLSLDGYFNQARELEKRGNFSAAEKVYQAAMAASPDRPEILKRLGIIYQTEFKFDESIDAFQKVLQQAPEYPEVNFYLGLSYF